MSLRKKFFKKRAGANDDEEEDEEADLQSFLAEMRAENAKFKKKEPANAAPAKAPKPKAPTKPAAKRVASPQYCTQCKPECAFVQSGRCGRTGMLVDQSKLLERGYTQVQQGNVMTFVSQKVRRCAIDVAFQPQQRCDRRIHE